MMRRLSILFFQFIFISVGLCEFSESKDKYINALVNYLNGLVDQPFVYDEAELVKALEINENEYYIEIKVKASDQASAFSKYQNCTGTLNKDGDGQLSVKESQCSDYAENWTENLEELVTDVTNVDGPIQLENEVQTENMSTSGEQFIAIPRDRPAPCIGCATIVDPAAAGVKELATLGIKQLDRHEPNTRHALNNVLLVERQVQVVGGVRYIMTLSIDYDNCTTNESDGCNFQQTCRIAVLEKPWQKLPDGSKFRAIISNNCTDEWLFDENGMLESNFNNHSNDINPTPEYDQTGGADEILKAIHNNDVQALPVPEKSLTDEQMKELEEQIIPKIKNQPTIINSVSDPAQEDKISEVKSKNLEAEKPITEHTLPQQSEPNKFIESLPEDKKKTIDELISFFDFAGYKDKENHDELIRMKRDYGSDLQMLNIAEKYQDMKTKLKNAQFIHKLALAMVDHINEMDIEVKTRVLKEVISAEEENENDRRYFYVQAQVVVPCAKADCKNKEINICNGIIDASGEQPLVLYTVCNAEQKHNLGKLKYIPKNDPILLKFLKSALMKIDAESKIPFALRIRNILNASTQKVSGTLTKITVEIEYTECFKSVPLFRRSNCTVIENLGYKVCDIEVVQRHWIKETKMTYVCSDRPVDEIFVSDPKQTTVDDPKILEIVQEALQNLEVQSNRNKKMKVIEIRSVATKQVAGLLTNVVFTVGYTACSSEYKDDVNSCQLLENEPLRNCSVEVWERAWLREGRRLNVNCDDLSRNVDSETHTKLSRNKRSIQTNAAQIEQDPNKYTKLADDCLTNYLVTYEQTQHYKVVKIDKAVKVNESGDMTIIDFEAAPTNCAVKNGYPTSSPCEVQNSEDTLSCHATVWSKPELNSRIMNVNCQINEKKFRRKRDISVGGQTSQDPNKPKYKKLAEKSLTKYVLKARKSQHHAVVTIQEVKTQVVSGIKTSILFKASPTNCVVDRRGKPSSKTCVIEDPNVVLRCSADILEQPWAGKEDIDVNCHPDSRQKRQIPGGEIEQNRNDPVFMQLAQESLAKYVASEGSAQEHKILEIERVATHVVAGQKTIIDFKVQTPGDVLRCHSEIWEKSWEKFKQIDVKCDPINSRQKRQLVGGPMEKDRNDPVFMQLAQESLAKYVASESSAQEHKILEIEKVFTQVVAGQKTIIDFTVQTPGDVIRCHSEIWEKTWENFKQIDVKCEPINSRQKRQIPGGEMEKDRNDPVFMQLAQESLAKYVDSKGSAQEHKILEIEKVFTQVVAGQKTIIDFTVQTPGDVIRCHSEIWEKPWENFKQIDVKCDPINSRQKRQLVGGLMEKDRNDPVFMQLAQESLAKYVASESSAQEHKILEIEKVFTQVVAGQKTIIDFTVQTPGDVIRCHSEIWEKTWENFKQIDVKCEPVNSRQKRQIPGGEMVKDRNDPVFMQLAQESLAKYVDSKGSAQEHKILEIEKVFTQVVAGQKTIIDFTVQTPGDVIRCHSEIWEKPWENFKQIDVKCDPINSRQKRQLVGGLMEKDRNDPVFMQLAQESLAKYVDSKGSAQEHKILEIEKVFTQVVAGHKTIIDFTVQTPGDVIQCHSEIWEKTWENFKQIDVKCEPINSRQKRQIPGGEMEKDRNDPVFMQLAQESLAKYVDSKGSAQEHKILEIEKVFTQVVAGQKTIIDFTVQTPGDVLRCHSEIWEKTWENFKQIDVKCDPINSRQKRELKGGLKEQDRNDPAYMQLAQESLAKYVDSEGMAQEHKILEIEKVTTQVVAGQKTIIDFTVQTPGDVIRCHSEIWEKPWENFKQIDVKCDSINSRQKRQLVGGLMEKDRNDPVYMQLAQESLAKYVASESSAQEHKILEIEKVLTQVVAGQKTIIDFTVQTPGDVIRCHSEIWEKPWENFKQIDVKCDPINSRQKRQLVGGLMEKDRNDPVFMQQAQESLAKYVASESSAQEHKILEIEKVFTQVVAGQKTIIDFTVQTPGDVIRCHSEIWEKPWENFKQIDVKCEPEISRQKRQLVGGLMEKDRNDPVFMQLAQESLAKYVDSKGSAQEHKILEIEKVFTQVVAGQKTIIDFTVQTPGDVIRCHSEIWEKTWENFKQIDVKCEPKNSRQKRQIPGGEMEKDRNDPVFMQLAQESLAKYVDSKGSAQEHKILEIEKVLTQVVAGQKTIIDFTVQTPGDVIRCHSEIWEKPWENFKQIDVKCDPINSRQKRQLVGGLMEKDRNDPVFMQQAQESLAKYVASESSAQEHKILEIEKVFTQVVAGQKTIIDFTVQTPDDVLRCHSEIWEKTWENFKQIDVKCDPINSRQKRELKGGLKEQDQNDPAYMQLAQESLAKYVASKGSAEEHKILEIEKVTKQGVAGKLTRIDFKVQTPNDVFRCHSEIWEKPWENFKQIDVKCDPINSRQKRQSSEKPLLGGVSVADKNNPKYTQLAEESLAKYVLSIGSTDQHKIIEIKNAKKQVVSGTKTIIDFSVQGPDNVLECHSEIWEQSWLKKKEIDVKCSLPQSRNRREVQLFSAVRNLNKYKNSVHSTDRKSGGHKEEDPTKPKYAALAAEALRKYEKNMKSEILHKVVTVDHVVTQVVSGQKIFIDFTSAPTTCAANVSEQAALCDTVANTTIYCRAEIWDRPWLKRKKIEVYCNNDQDIDSHEDKRKKRSLYNASDLNIQDFKDNPDNTVVPLELSNENKDNSYLLKEIFYNSEHYLKAAEEALREYEIISKSDIIYKVVKIYYVNEGDDAGIRVRIDFSASPTNCLRTNYTKLENCEFMEPKELISCHADVRLAMMLDNNLVKNYDVKCSQRKRKKVSLGDVDKVRNKRQMPLEEDVEEELMYYYADLVMNKLNSRFSGDNLYKLITVHDIRRTIHMKTPLVRMYLEVGKTYCLRGDPVTELSTCNEIDGLTHILCYARLWPSIYDDLVLQRTDAVCEDEIRKFVPLAGFHTIDLLSASVLVLNRDGPYANLHREVGEDAYLTPTLDYNKPFKLSFIVVGTNCTKEYASTLDPTTNDIMKKCIVNTHETAKRCISQIYMSPNSRTLRYVNVSCMGNIKARTRRSVSLNPKTITEEDVTIQKYVKEALEQLEMVSVLRYKQRVLVINRYSSKTTTTKQTTIDFDVGYTNCLKYEWVDNITDCEFLEHLPRRHCVAVVGEKLWSDNSRKIDVNCEDDETPLEANMELETAQAATTLAKEALKRIEYKYPHPRRQIVVRIFSLEKQMVAGVHYRMKLEVGYSTCMALSVEEDCKLDPLMNQRKFCRVNVWLRSWTNHPPSYRVTCDYHDGAISEIYHHMQAQELFSHFLATHKPSYMEDQNELPKRFEIFRQNVKKIHELNVYEMGTARYAVTQYADLSTEEFRSKYLGLDPKLRDENQVPMPEAEIPDVTLPDSFDWRDHDAVTEVKNQGSCGSCWAFSVTGNIEGQWKRHSGKLVSLSEQELVDCDKLDKGCNGGLPDNAYRAIEQLGGLELESDYPYEGEDDKCVYNSTLSRVQISGAVNISSNETNMAKWLVKNGPISIGINANAMQFYMGGISHPWKMLCNPSNLDHGVLIVGYGMKNYPLFNKKLPYWIVKNSWGPTWGEQGYYRVYRGDGTCGVNQMASSAVI